MGGSQTEKLKSLPRKVQASLNRIRASKKLTTMPKELDFEETINTVKRRAKLDLGEKLLDAAGDDEAGTTIRRRALKVFFDYTRLK